MRICGIDEAGRGSIAGSLAVAGVILNSKIEGLKDSKKLSEKKREELYPKIVASSYYHIVLTNSEEIDEIGLSNAIKNSLKEIIETLSADRYIFDGNNNFGVENLETIVKADTKIDEVTSAGILAKVTRDREILEFAKEFPKYQFEKNRGYLTKTHIEKIVKYGYSRVHRKSYRIKSLSERKLF